MGKHLVGFDNWQLILVTATTLVLPACEVDDRHLLGVTSNADTAGTGSASSGGSVDPLCTDPGESDAGATGGTGSTVFCPNGGTASICPDLNSNNIPDSQESLVPNSTFDAPFTSDSVGWVTEVGTGFGWNPEDACGHSDSGSISVTNPFAGGTGPNITNGAMLCLSVAPGHIYVMIANAKPVKDSLAGLGLAFHTSSDCSGDALTQFNSNFIINDGYWHKSTTSGVAPEDAGSLAVRLIVAAPKTPSSGFGNSLFDNILVLEL